MSLHGRSRGCKWRRCGRYLSGSAAMEYVVLLGVLVIGAVAAWTVTGLSAGHVYGLTARVMKAPHDGQWDSRLAGSAPRAIRDEEGSDLQQYSSVEASVASALLLAVGVMVWSGTMTLGVVLWRALRAKRKRKIRTAAHTPAAAVPLSRGAFKRLIEKRQQIRRLLARDLDMSPGVETQVRQLMSKTLTIVKPDVSVAKVATTMREQRIRHLLVCHQDGELVGIISDRNVIERPGKTAAEIMTSEPVVASPETAIGPAITLMLNRSFSCLPIVDNGQLCGVLTTTDLLLSFQCLLQVIASESLQRYQVSEVAT